MYFANPWGLLALAALPVIAAIHLYQRRFPPLYVAGAHLWSSQTQLRTAGRRRDKLPVSASLLLELVAAFLLAMVLSQPRFGDLDQVAHLVVVLDNSASMQGQPPGEPTFRQAALTELQERAHALGRRSVYTLILTGRRPVMLAGPAVAWEQVEEKLSGWQPNLPRHQFSPACDLARQLVEESGELLFLTDRIPESEELPANMEVVSVGRKLENVALSAARWTFDSTTGTGNVYLRAQNHGRLPADVAVSGRARGQEVFQKSLSLQPGASAALDVPVAGGLQQLTVQLQSKADGLAADNLAQLIEPQVRSVKIAATLPEGQAREAVRRVLGVMHDVSLTETDAAELAIGPAAVLPESKHNLWWLGIGPLSTDEAAQKAAKDLLGPFLIDKRHPLVDGVVLGGVVWGGVQPVTLDVNPLVTTGQTTLLAQLRGTRTTAFLLNIDLARSNLPQSPDWPILLTNLVELRRGDLPGLQRWNYRLGEPISFRLYEGDDPAANAPLTLVHVAPTGQSDTRNLVRNAVVELPLLEETGVFDVRSGTDSFGKFAVNFFDAEESDLKSLAPGRRAAKTPQTAARISLDSPYSWAAILGIALILLCIFADWYVLRTRRI